MDMMCTTPVLSPRTTDKMASSCSWCQAAHWKYRCSICDPRMEKVLCLKCSILWHSRGFACNHQLTNRYGVTRSFSAWMQMQQHRVNMTNSSSNTEVQEGAVLNGWHDILDGVPAQGITINSMEGPTRTGSEKQDKPQEEETKVATENDRGLEESKGELVEEAAEFVEVVNESVDIGEDEDTTSVEEIEFKEDATNTSAIEALANESLVAGLHTPMERSRRKVEGPFEVNDREDYKNDSSASAVQGVTSSPFMAPAATNPSAHNRDASSATVEYSTVPASSHDPAPAATTPDTGIALMPHEPTRASVPGAGTSANRTSSNWMSQPNQVNLEKLLRWFPTTDPILVEMLAACVEEALVMEDALICARIGKCQESSCRSVLLHHEHCKLDKVCGDPRCAEISIVYRHRRACSKRTNAITMDGSKFVCPFCLRIRQRRSLGVVAALDHLISDQRRALQEAHSEANRNDCLQSINTWSKRKQVLYAEIDRLNRLASESNAVIFNFPRYQWHFGDAVFIKREPVLLDCENDTTGLSAPGLSMNRTNESTATEQPSLARCEVEHSSVSGTSTLEYTLQSEDIQGESITGDANFGTDFINELLRAKSKAGDGRDVLQQEFDGVMELGYAIVDASFCAPSKAQRCLLNCKSILIHLQHHLDLQVCTQAMCAAVEHHFSHLSQCKARDDSESCEYCLRVEERQLMRSVDIVEAEQPEAEAKVQKIINDITASFTNHRPDEREQEVIQLEDELEQAETNKQELLKKVSAARMNLRKVRRSMEHHDMTTSISRQLPVHFIKVRRAEGLGSSSSSKKRRLNSSIIEKDLS